MLCLWIHLINSYAGGRKSIARRGRDRQVMFSLIFTGVLPAPIAWFQRLVIRKYKSFNSFFDQRFQIYHETEASNKIGICGSTI